MLQKLHRFYPPFHFRQHIQTDHLRHHCHLRRPTRSMFVSINVSKTPDGIWFHCSKIKYIYLQEELLKLERSTCCLYSDRFKSMPPPKRCCSLYLQRRRPYEQQNDLICIHIKRMNRWLIHCKIQKLIIVPLCDRFVI